MAERGDLTVLHEPFCNLKDYGETDVDGRTFDSAAELLAWLRGEGHDRDVFFKDTMDHQHDAVLADRPFLAEAHHAFLIRRPEEIAASYYALFPPMTINAIGMERLCEMQAAISDAAGIRLLSLTRMTSWPGQLRRWRRTARPWGCPLIRERLPGSRVNRPSGGGQLIGTRTLATVPVSSGANGDITTPSRTPRSSHGTPPITGPFTSSFMYSG
jgi:hypothetical protein